MDEDPLTDWYTGLCDCFEDANTCCYGFWCCPCLACTVSSRFGENTCLPLCDMFSPAITSAFGIPLLIASPALLSLRSSIRHKHKIKGSLCRDIAVSCFCVWCGWCQLHRELRHLRENPTVINVINVQPVSPMQHPPVMMMPAYPMQVGSPMVSNCVTGV